MKTLIISFITFLAASQVWAQVAHDHSKMTASNTAASNENNQPMRSPHEYSDGLKTGADKFTASVVPKLVLADTKSFWALNFDRIEYAQSLDNENEDAYKAQAEAWYGPTFSRWVFQIDHEQNYEIESTEVSLLRRYAVASMWDFQAGLRAEQEDDEGDSALGIGFTGLAPYWFEIELMMYITDDAAVQYQFEAEYDVLFTQRLIGQFLFEQTASAFYDTQDEQKNGPNETSIGLRFMYEFNRQFAPYIGLERIFSYERKTQDSWQESFESEVALGLKAWF